MVGRLSSHHLGQTTDKGEHQFKAMKKGGADFMSIPPLRQGPPGSVTPNRSAESLCALALAPRQAYSPATASESPRYAHLASVPVAPGAGEMPKTAARILGHRSLPGSDPESSAPCRAGADEDAATPRARTGSARP